jgi:hypothetical protein
MILILFSFIDFLKAKPSNANGVTGIIFTVSAPPSLGFSPTTITGELANDQDEIYPWNPFANNLFHQVI